MLRRESDDLKQEIDQLRSIDWEKVPSQGEPCRFASIYHGAHGNVFLTELGTNDTSVLASNTPTANPLFLSLFTESPRQTLNCAPPYIPIQEHISATEERHNFPGRCDEYDNRENAFRLNPLHEIFSNLKILMYGVLS